MSDRPSRDPPASADTTRRADNAPSETTAAGSVEGQRPLYTESQVITATVKIITPFALTYGLFVTFHGADSPGGGFQGGAIAAAVVFMIAFAFGIEATRDWLSNTVIVGLAAGGVIAFSGIGLAGIGFDGSFLEYGTLPIKDNVKYGIEAIEIGGVAAIVSGILVGLFFALAAGFNVSRVNVEQSDETSEEATTKSVEVDS